MKHVRVALLLVTTISQAEAVYTSTEIVFRAPTVPSIDKPACAKVEILKNVTIPDDSPEGMFEWFEFTYMVTLESQCQGVLTLTSTYDSRANHHTESIKKSYSIQNGILTEIP